MARADPVTILVADGEPRAFPSALAALSHARELQPGVRIGIDTEEAAAARLCAPFELAIDGREPAVPGGQAGALLCFLLARPERAAGRDELIAVAWPERPPR